MPVLRSRGKLEKKRDQEGNSEKGVATGGGAFLGNQQQDRSLGVHKRGVREKKVEPPTRAEGGE